jgi:hypothetical protein
MNPQIPREPNFGDRADANSAFGSLWWASHEGVMAKGHELDLPARPGETFNDYKARLFRRLEVQQ